MRQYAEIDVVRYGGLEPILFTYLVPKKQPQLSKGSLVLVPFGARQSLGVVTQLLTTLPDSFKQEPKPIDQVLDAPIVPPALVELAFWMKSYYAASSYQVWTTLLPSGLTAKRRDRSHEVERKPATIELPQLSPAQQTALQAIEATSTPSILQGVTGSGKTHIYEILIERGFRNGQSTIMLVPEIFLTEQLHRRLERRFGSRVVATHSGLTAAARRNIWLDAANNKTPKLYIGPRSALFLPVQKLGLIIIDEAHDTSYKQENAPRYMARDVAAQLARLTDSKLLLASATPDISTLWLAQHGKLSVVPLDERHGLSDLPSVRLVDMRGLHEPLSPSSLAAVSEQIANGHQVLILHNKRGTARRLSCDNCGESLICPRCDSALIFHADSGRMRCHSCGFNQFPPARCPACKSSELHFHGFGTKRLESELKERFPSARIARIDRDEQDSDTLKASLTASELGEVDILIGTQMIAKGLDIARITLVVIIGADELVSGTDYASREHGAALIMQAAGRAGRAEHPGIVLIQTRQPDHPTFHALAQHDWNEVFRTEIDRRKEFRYPPFRYLAKILFSASSLEKAEARAQTWLSEHPKLPPGVEAIGPTIPNHYRTAPKRYHVQLILRALRRSDLTTIAHSLPPQTSIDIDPISLF